MSAELISRFCHNILLIPYAVAIETQAHYAWQRNLGSYLDRIAGRFSGATILCRVVTPQDPTYVRDNQPIYGYEMVSSARIVSFNKLGGLFAQMFWLSRLTREADFSYIFLPSFKGLVAALFCWLLRKPYAIYMGADWQSVATFLVSSRLRGFMHTAAVRLISLLEGWVVREARFTIIHGDASVKHFGGEARRVFAAKPVVNWGREAFYQRADTCVRDEIIVLYLGALNPRKGIDHLIAGFDLAQKNLTNLRLVLVGAGEAGWEAQLKKTIQARGLQNQVHFKGYLSDTQEILSLYRAADLFILPSLGEGFPRVVYEAMSQGLPVIATRISSISVVLEDHQSALLVEPRSPEQIAMAIRELVESPELRQRLIRRGYLLAHNRMDTELPIQQFDELFHRFVCPSDKVSKPASRGL